MTIGILLTVVAFINYQFEIFSQVALTGAYNQNTSMLPYYESKFRGRVSAQNIITSKLTAPYIETSSKISKNINIS